MTINHIVFYNGHQHGDIANSRGVLDYLVKHIHDPSIQLYYVHDKHPDSILFGDRIKAYNSTTKYNRPFPYGHDDSTSLKHSHSNKQHFCSGDMLFINLWIGNSTFYQINRGPVGGGITRKSLIYQTKECIDAINQYCGLNIIYPDNTLDVIPKNLQPPKNQSLANEFMFQNFPRYRKKILIPNGLVQSDQTPQFSFSDRLFPMMEKHEDVLFLYTAKFNKRQLNNCYFIDDICPVPNLNEIEYISQFCDVLLTRCSGPGCIILNKNNYQNTSKTIISLTSSPQIAFEALASEREIENRRWGSSKTAKMIWSNNFSTENIQKLILDNI